MALTLLCRDRSSKQNLGFLPALDDAVELSHEEEGDERFHGKASKVASFFIAS